ncbi:hypothetical protein DASC09_058480 [Saccharomycopsis crataegensis]|uniref:Uncharacterized protein n=1 Tax=Saccharomycopsis crataegensis TaxID=43959 RepID=A0AAV5QUN6_9ASCO|nr:hypothetical protein DASC09_058480 [Saccharomycopsis crataegensis]
MQVPLPYRNYQFERMSMSEVRPRHILVFMLFLYVLLECIVVGSCISNVTKSAYVAKLTYIGSDNTEYFYSDTISKLNVRVGYFSTCIQTETSTSTGSWQCHRNETELLINDSNFNSSSPPDEDLAVFFKNTAYMFRHDCMSPWILVVAIIISFFTIFAFAIVPPSEASIWYVVSTGGAFFSFSLSLVAAVWQETNTLTGTKLMEVMADDYFSLETHYGNGARALIWIGVVLLGIGFTCLLFMTIVSIKMGIDREMSYYQSQMGMMDPAFGVPTRNSSMMEKFS